MAVLMKLLPAVPALVLLWLACPPPAARAEGLHCDIPANPAGFVGLLEKPSTRAREVARMLPGDEIELLEGSRGKWVEVLHWHGHDRKNPARARDTRRGWVQARLIGACS
jgi:hypothetical protein